MSAELMLLPLLRLSPCPFLRTRVAVMPCLRSSALAMAGLELEISPLARRPCLSVPSQTNNALAAISHLDPLMPCGHAVDFGQTGNPLHDLDQAITPQVGVTVRTRLPAQFDAVSICHDKSRDLWSNFNYFIDSDT